MKKYIWDGNTSREFLDSRNLKHLPEGDMGETYGFNMRNYGGKYVNCKTKHTSGFDQLKYVINEIKNNPHSRRILINLWNQAHYIMLLYRVVYINISFMLIQK